MHGFVSSICGFLSSESFHFIQQNQLQRSRYHRNINKLDKTTTIYQHQKRVQFETSGSYSIAGAKRLACFCTSRQFKINVYDFQWQLFQMPKKCLDSYITRERRSRTHVKLKSQPADHCCKSAFVYCFASTFFLFVFHSLSSLHLCEYRQKYVDNTSERGRETEFCNE